MFPATDAFFIEASSRTAARWVLRGPSLTLLDVASDFEELRLVFACLAVLDLFRI